MLKTIVFSLFLGLCWAVARLVAYVQRRLYLYRLRSRTEHVYIVGCLPDGTAPELMRTAAVVTLVPSTDVWKSRQQWIEDLATAQNEHGVEVYQYQYQYGEDVNENGLEYAQRVDTSVAMIRKKHHGTWSQTEERHYQKFAANQVFEWNGTHQGSPQQ